MSELQVRNRVRRAAKAAARGGMHLMLLAGVAAFCERPASAYADPGAGTLIWQMAMAGLVGGLFYLRKALVWLRRKDPRR